MPFKDEQRAGERDRKRRKKKIWIGVLVIVLMIIAVGLYWYFSHQNRVNPASQMPLASASSGLPPAPVSVGSVPQHYPVPGPAKGSGESTSNRSRATAGNESAMPLPGLGHSDNAFSGALANILGAGIVKKYVMPHDLIHRFVVTVDDLGRKGPIPLNVRAVPPTEGELRVEHSGDTITLSPENARRYDAAVSTLQHLDTQAVVSVYFHYYPLFQQAYEKLGFPNRYFNDRLVQVLGEMIDAPEINGPIRLVQPHVLYKFANPALRKLTAGQKLMIRMGRSNEAIVKARLRKLRAAIIAGARQVKGTS